MLSYATGKIYKITSPNTDKIYIGSTIQSLHRRMIQHKSDTKKNRNISSSIILLEGDATIELIEEYPCLNRAELESREEYYMELYSDYCINKQKAVVDKKAYDMAYRKSERCKALRQKWLDEHKEEMKEYTRQRAKLPHIVERTRKYRETHKAEISIGHRKYRENNREKIVLEKKQYYDWIKSMGGDFRYNNNITRIDPTLFS
jgi:glutamine synthetase type III